MAVRAFVIVDNNMRSVTGSWSGLTQTTSDTGAPVELPDYADRSVQCQGTIGAGGHCLIEGSNDGSNYVQLTDPQGNAIDFAAASKIEQIEEITRYVRPRISAGDGTTNLVVTFYGRRL